MYAALSAAQWVVGKALAPVADGLLGAWAATKNFGPNVEALSTELLLVKAMLEQAALKELSGPAMEMLLQKLRDSAHNAEDLLDELDYFRIHDKLHNTDDAADEHGKGCIRDLAFNARHTTKAVGKLVNCCTWQRAKRRQKSHGDPSLARGANQEVSGCMPKLGKLLPCGDDNRGNAQETPKLEFNRVQFSQRMKDIVEKLRVMRNDVSNILVHCGPKIVPNIAQNRPITKARIVEPKLYGRDAVMDSIIHDITNGQYCDKSLTVLPIVGPGGMGKTTLIQHICHNQQVQHHFPVVIWVCVSFNFNLDKVLEQIKTGTCPTESEKEASTTEELIEDRLKSKRFLLVLDDIWQLSNGGDWENLLSILNQSQENGCMILVTTRFQAIAQKVNPTGHSIELGSLQSGEFRKLFYAFVFGDEQCPRDKHFLLETGDKIMEKLKGSPLAAKTIGRLLSKELSLYHWKRVLKSKEWEKQTDGIMSALRLSYDFLPFHLQQCFSYSALVPEDIYLRSYDLISLWIGLDILIPSDQNQTIADIGLSYLNELVIHGFFREEETDGDRRYVMHDLLHDLALKVASHDCLSLRLPNVGSVEIQPSTRHLSIITEHLDEYDAVSAEILKSQLEEMKKTLKIEHLQSLMLFGKINDNFAKIFGNYFREAKALRVLYVLQMMYPIESMFHNFSGLVHLRCLCLGTKDREMHLPLDISKFYHLRILDLEPWHGSHDFPEDLSNLAKLCHIHTFYDESYSDIYNVGKLELLEELKIYRVKKKSEGFEPNQLEHLTKLRELGIYNLEKLRTKEEAAQAKLIEKNYLRRLTLDWYGERSTVEPGVEAMVLESLQPHGDLQVLCIRGHGGPSCPTWLGDEFAVEALRSLYLYDVSWEVFPSLGKAWDLRELRLKSIARPKEFIIEKSFCMLTMLELIGLGSFEKWIYPAEQESSFGGDLLPPDANMFPLLQVLIIRECPRLLGLPFSNHIVSPDCFPKLQEFEVCDCPEFLPVIPISWIESLRSVTMKCLKMLEKFAYSKSSDGGKLKIVGKGDLRSLYLVLFFDKETGLENLTLERCPPLQLKQLLMLTSLKTLIVENSVGLVRDLLPPDMFPLLQVLIVRDCPKLLGFPFSNHIVSPDWFPKLQALEICDCPEFLSVIPMSLIESLRHVMIVRVKLLQKLEYSKSSDGGELSINGKGDLHSLDQVLVFDEETCFENLTLEKCPPLQLKHLQMLTSLKKLFVQRSDCLVGPLRGGQGDVEWQLPVEEIWINDLSGNSGKELTELLPHLPKLSKLHIEWCKNIKKLVVGVDVQQTTSKASEMGGGEITAAAEEEDDGVLLFPAQLCDSLLELEFLNCQELVLVDPPALVPGGGWLQAVRSLQRLTVKDTPKFLSAFSISRHIFPSSLQYLKLKGVKGMGTLEPLSNLSSLVTLKLIDCGEDLECHGLQSLLAIGGQLSKLEVLWTPVFFAGWDPNSRRALKDIEGGEEQQTQLVSSTLLKLCTDDIAGLLAAPICRFLSISLTKLELWGHWCEGMERFIKEQEDALQLLSSLQELEFWEFHNLEQLPAGLRNLTSLKILSVNCCPAVSSLPNDALPDSLEKLDVIICGNKQLKQHCRGLVGTIPQIKIDY